MISDLYTSLLTVLRDNITGVLIKADTEEWESTPGLGLGVPNITEVDELSQENKIDIDIPVVIIGAGTRQDVSYQIVQIYENMRSVLNTYLDAQFTTDGIQCEAAKIGNFQPLPIGQDPAIRGLTGLLSFRLEL